jgi:hypothetical protein
MRTRHIRGQGALAAEELLTVVELVRGILGAIVGREFQLVEARRSHALAGSMENLLKSATQVW